MDAVKVQDPVKVALEFYRAALENKNVRVLDINIRTADTIPVHSPPVHIDQAFCLTLFPPYPKLILILEGSQMRGNIC
jgi:hypothetical protein